MVNAAAFICDNRGTEVGETSDSVWRVEPPETVDERSNQEDPQDRGSATIAPAGPIAG